MATQFEWQKPRTDCYLCAEEKGIKLRTNPFPKNFSCASCFSYVCAKHYREVRDKYGNVLPRCVRCQRKRS